MSEPMPDRTTDERVALLEHQVDILRRAIALLVVSATPTVDWLEKSWNPSEPKPPKRKRL